MPDTYETYLVHGELRDHFKRVENMSYSDLDQVINNADYPLSPDERDFLRLERIKLKIDEIGLPQAEALLGIERPGDSDG
jgi:hypothetical protein